MLIISTSLYMILKRLRSTYSGKPGAQSEYFQTVVTLLGGVSSSLQPYLGHLHPISDGTVTVAPLTDSRVMADYSDLVLARDLAREDGRLPKLETSLDLYIKKISAILARQAIVSTEVADFVDVVKWGDELAV